MCCIGKSTDMQKDSGQSVCADRVAKAGEGRRVQLSSKRKLGSTVAATASMVQQKPEELTNAARFRRAFKVPRR